MFPWRELACTREAALERANSAADVCTALVATPRGRLVLCWTFAPFWKFDQDSLAALFIVGSSCPFNKGT